MGLFGPPNIEKMKARRDIFRLTMALFYQKDRQVRTDAARALGELKDVRAVHALIDALIEANKTHDFIAGREVGEALEKIGTPAVEKLIDALKNRNAPVVEVLGNIGDARAVETLIIALKNGSVPAAEALMKIGENRVMEPLIAALKNRDAKVRAAAAGALGNLKDARAVEPLIAALKDSESLVVQAVAQALGDLNDARAVEPLIVAFKNGSGSVRISAAIALGKLKDVHAVEPLTLAINDNNADVRRKAAEALVNIGTPAIEPLIKALENKDLAVRRIIVEVLAKIGTPPVEQMVAALKGKNIFLREAAVLLLNKIGWIPGDNEIGAYYWIAANNLKECVRIGAPAFNPLINELPYCTDPATRDAFVKALGQIDKPRTVDFLVSALKDKVLRFVAVSALGDLKATGAVEVLITILKHEDQSMHRMAAIALGNIGDARALEPLIAALNDKDSGDAAAVALGKIGANVEDTALRTRAVEALIVASTSNKNAVSSLGKIGDPRAVEFLITALKDKDASTRKEAIQALGYLKDARAVEPLLGIATDATDKDLSTSAVWALENIGDIRAVDPLIRMFKEGAPRMAIVRALGKIGANVEDTTLRVRIVDLLIGAIESINLRVAATYTENVPRAAAEALGVIGDARAVEPLIRIIKSQPLQDAIRRAAAVALVSLYHAGKLNETDKKLILDHRGKIITPHGDNNWDTEGCEGLIPHDDTAPVEFPL